MIPTAHRLKNLRNSNDNEIPPKENTEGRVNLSNLGTIHSERACASSSNFLFFVFITIHRSSCIREEQYDYLKPIVKKNVHYSLKFLKLTLEDLLL